MTTNEGNAARLAPYLDLLSAFVEHGLPAAEFERRYLDLYLNDPTEWTEQEFLALDALFGDVDAFEPDPQLLPQVIGGIDEATLRARCAETLATLRRPASGSSPGQ